MGNRLYVTQVKLYLVTQGNEPIPTSLPNGERPSAPQSNSDDAHENEVYYIITSDGTNYADHAAYSRNERLNDDVTKKNDASEATSNEESDWPNPAVYPGNPEKSLPNTDERPENDESFSERNLTNDNDAQKSPKRGMILSCPKYLKTMLEMDV